MNIHIINIFLAGVLVSPLCAAPKIKSKQLPNATKGTPRINTSSPVIAWGRGTKLEATKLSGGPIIVLRKRRENTNTPNSLPVWNFSPDGTQLVFSEEPSDVDFFNAGAYRDYVFLAKFNTSARVVLAAYGPKAVSDSSFYFPAFDSTGQRIIVEEDAVGQFMSSSSKHWIGIYDVRTRRRVFDSRTFVSALPTGKVKSILSKSNLEAPSLSPDGNDIICIATYDDGDSVEDSITYPPQLVHLDLKHKSAEILISPNDRLPKERQVETNTIAQDSAIYDFGKQFAWHPTQKKFVLQASTDLDTKNYNLFSFNLKTHKTERLSNGGQGDFSPRWSLDGKQLFWIRSGMKSKQGADNQIMRANADGSNPAVFLPQVRGVFRIQLLSKLAPWSRYSKLSIERTAAPDNGP